ncbi:gliding motility-associated C-terminal domain-containing protein [candidate division KSB1 bacterium]|nr:gliding motility-associated C-terminal domain-containing protein [candidate division KSB1 bacterium]
MLFHIWNAKMPRLLASVFLMPFIIFLYFSTILLAQKKSEICLRMNNTDFQVDDDSSAADQSNPAISSASDGSFIIIWEDKRSSQNDIYFQRYDSSGQTQENNIRVNDNICGINRPAPDVASAPDGSFEVVWCDGFYPKPDIYLQCYNNSGHRQGDNKKVFNDSGSSNRLDPVVSSSPNGSFVIVWTDYRNGNYDIYFQRYDSAGRTQGANTIANDDTSNSQQYHPAVASSSQGSFLVAWEDKRHGNSDIYMQCYDSDGVKQGGNLKVNDDSFIADRLYPAVTSTSDSTFTVVWDDRRNGNSDIYLQRYDNIGIALGNNDKVNDDSNDSFQSRPAISSCADGSFVVAWQDNRHGNLNSDIYAQKYNADGTKIDSNFLVNNDEMSANQLTPDVSINGNREIICVWKDDRVVEQGYDIFATIMDFDTTGAVPEPDIDISETEHDFGDVPIATTAPWEFTIKNVGTDTLIISKLSLTESVFSVNDSALTLPESASLEITVTYHSDVVGSFHDVLKIHSNDPDEPVVEVLLSARGVFPSQETISILPNPFTPNNDGYNDYVEFKYPNMYTEAAMLQIFNLKGRKVKEINDVRDHQYRWYGKDDDGMDLMPGVYIYILKANGKRLSSGTITLIR